MGSYKKIGLSHEMGLIDTPPFKRISIGRVFFFFGVSLKIELAEADARGHGRCTITLLHMNRLSKLSLLFSFV